MRWIRFLSTMAAARSRAPLRITDASRMMFRVWLTDIDLSIMNHAAMMTVMETGRIDFMVRTGFLKLARRNKWYFPSSSIQVQFVRPLKALQKAELVTRVFFIDETRIYMEQKIFRESNLVASAIVRSTIKKGREQVNILEVLHQLDIGSPVKERTEFIEQIELCNQMMREL